MTSLNPPAFERVIWAMFNNIVMDRRQLLHGAGAALLTIGASQWPSQGRAANAEIFMSPANISLLSAYTFVGKELGYYAKEGIELDVKVGPGTAASITQVAAGGAGFGQAASIATAPVILDQGADLITVGQVSYRGFFEIASPKDKPLNHPRDWQGRTIGIMSAGGSTDLLLDAMSLAEGLDPTNVKKVVTGTSAGGIGFIEQGTVDGFFVYYQSKILLENQDVDLHYLPTDAFAPAPGDAIVTQRSPLEDPERADIVRRYLRASRAGMEFVRDPGNETDVLDIFAQYNPIDGEDRATSARILQEVRSFSTPPEGVALMNIDAAAWENALAMFRKLSIVKSEEPDALKRIVTNAYWTA